MRRLGVLISILMAFCMLAGCGRQITDNVPETASEAEKSSPAEEVSEADAGETSAAEPETLFAGDFAEPLPSEQAVEDGDYYVVDDIEEGFCEIYDGMVFLDPAVSPLLEIGGIPEPLENNGEYYRLDTDRKEYYSYFNEAFANDPAGATIRFRTNAEQISVELNSWAVPDFPHVADRGAFGIDIYTGTGTDRRYCGGPMQFLTESGEMSDVIDLPGGYQEVLIELPQYAGVSDIKIGFPEGSSVAGPTKRSHGPVLFYGSSITQGMSTGRPGNSYTNILCRALDCDCINLGFSGSDLGEQEIADFIITRDFDVFVMDYNNNTTVEQLEETHYNFYKTVRDAKPDVPVLMLCKPYFTDEPDEICVQKEKIILDTVTRAREEGDDNVYFISAADYFPKEKRDLYTIDMVHPNDMGHYYMAKTIFPVLYSILNGAE